MNIKLLNKVLDPLKRRIQTMITRGVVTLVDSSLMMQELQVKVRGTPIDGVEHFEPYGFTAKPHSEAEALLACLGGNSSRMVAVTVADKRFRLKGLVDGEVALYTDEGDVIHFKRDNHIYVDSFKTITAKAPNVNIIASTKCTITSPETECSGHFTALGNVSDANGSMQEMRDTYNGHSHGYTDNGVPATTEVPGAQMS